MKANQEIRLPFFCPKRVYNVLLLFQCIAHHPETRSKLLRANMPYYFYPLIEAGYIYRSTGLVRIGALGVIAHLLKPPVDAAAVHFLMDTCGLGHCARAGIFGSDATRKQKVEEQTWRKSQVTINGDTLV